MGPTAVLALTAAAAGAFTQASAFSLGVAVPWQREAAAAHFDSISVAASRLRGSSEVAPTAPASMGFLLAGSLAAMAAGAAAFRLASRRGSSSRASLIARGPWKYAPVKHWMKKQGITGASERGPSYQLYLNLRHQAKKGHRYYNQQKILKAANIQSAKGGFPRWYPGRELFNLYKGPESHPDNKWFPAASPGYDHASMGEYLNGRITRSPYVINDQIDTSEWPPRKKSQESAGPEAGPEAAPEAGLDAAPEIVPEAVQEVPPVTGEAGAPPTQAEAFRSSAPFQALIDGSGGCALAAGRAPGLPLAAAPRGVSAVGRRPATASLVLLRAHKKAASSTKNQGRKQNPQYYGLTRKGYQGNAVKAGQILVRQKGFTWYPGANVSKGHDFTLSSLKDGIVQWRGNYKHREIFVVPWQYVNEKCVWHNPNTLGPKKYEPWMGTLDHDKRNHIHKLRREWLRSEEGKEFMKKKMEKVSRQKEIQKKIRAIKKAKLKAKLAEKADVVSAGGDSESEA